MVKITLQHAQINSGTAVSLDATTLALGWKNLLKYDPIPGKYDIVEVGFAGFENPTITVAGVIDLWTTPAKTHSTNTGATAVLDQEYLKDFAVIRDSITLTVPPSGTGSILYGRPTAGYATGSTMVGSFLVRINDFSMTPNSSSQSNYMIPYSITFVETVR